MINLDSILREKNSVGIAGHVRPDGDCVGSTLAMYNYIRKYFPNIDVKLYLEPIPNIFKFLKNSENICNDCVEENQFDLFISLDCGDTGRLGTAAKYFEGAKETLCIDHHISNCAFADNNYIEPHASSTCELIFELIGKDKIDKEIAECLYTGMVHDTGVFQYSCTSAKTMAIAGILMDKGIDYPKIVDDTFYTKTFNQNKILGFALLQSQLYLDGKCILSVVTKKDMEKYDVLPKHLDGIVNQLRVTKGVTLAVFMYENEDGSFKVSTRANDSFDAADLAVHFGGGGHVKAAGFTLYGTVQENVETVLMEVEKRL
ncbi:MAG: bifunctional oligoribonuclease/PAP phosphatase NrnA [Agathobacter sp.]|nr:bifunctional oligoribonuclease/PAP phosphatase NrnA [Agathobacter sp.]